MNRDEPISGPGQHTNVGNASLPGIAVTNIDSHSLALVPSDARVRYLANGVAHWIQLNNLVDHLARISGEVGFKHFLEGLPTRNQPLPRPDLNGVLHVQRSDSSGVPVIIRVLKLHKHSLNLLTHLWIDRVFVLGDALQSKAHCQPYDGNGN